MPKNTFTGVPQTLNSSQSEAWWRKHYDMGMFLILWGRAYLSQIRDQFEYNKILVMLPYAESLNPTEKLWGDIKHAVSEAKPRNAEGLWNVV